MSRAHGGDEPTPAEMLMYGPTESESRLMAVCVAVFVMACGAAFYAIAGWLYSHVSVTLH